MIFPVLRGLVSFRFAPVTWTVIALNFVCLLYTTFFQAEAQAKLESIMRDSFYLETQGQLYAHYLTEAPAARYSVFLRELGQRVEDGDVDAAESLGQLAFRDDQFYADTTEAAPDADPVAFRNWKKNSGEARALEEVHPSFALGLNTDEFNLSQWVSYMFVHSGFGHFAGNMLFLVIFGAALEAQVGGFVFLATYLLFGVCAAGVFAVMTGVSGTPLVGASGAISGTMAFYGLLNWRRPVRFFYWFFLPLRGYIGLVYLPAGLALLLAVAADIAGWLSTVPEFGGVAHAAHLGGDLAGVLAGLGVLAVRRLTRTPPEVLPVMIPKPLTLLPFFPPGQNRAA